MYAIGMRVVRKILVFFLALILPLFLFTLAIDTGVIKLAGNASSVKKILADSHIYSGVINSAFDQAKNTGGEEGGGISLTDPAIKAAAQKTFTPQFLQQSTETVLDSVYRWLDGSTPVPDFRIDLGGLKTTFAAAAAEAAQQRAATLPQCPPALSPSSYDPFSASCLPKGMTPASAAALTKNDLSSAKGFLDNPVITADSVRAANSNQSIFADQLKDVPQIYQRVKQTPIVLALLSLVLALGIIFLSVSRRKGLRHVGVILVSAGSFLMLLAWGLNYGVSRGGLNGLNKLDNNVLAGQVRTLAVDLIQNLDKTYWIFGGTYATLGAVAIAGPMLASRRKGEHMEAEQPAETETPVASREPDITPEISTPEPKPEPRPKPKKKSAKKILIQ